jgi:hypothetical protein
MGYEGWAQQNSLHHWWQLTEIHHADKILSKSTNMNYCTKNVWKRRIQNEYYWLLQFRLSESAGQSLCN